MNGMETNIIIFDKQDITRLGIETLINLSLRNQPYKVSFVNTKNDLIHELILNPESLVILDYTLSDMNSADGLLNIGARFQETHWILFSEDLSIQFLRKIIYSSDTFSVVLKNSDLLDIKTTISSAYKKQLFICSQVKNLLLMDERGNLNKDALTITEKEMLKEIALGRKTKEIATIRNISVHTVITHRKNIYRKLDVNNVQEASRYALQAGIVDASDYFI